MHEDRRLGVSTIVLSSLRTRRRAASPVDCEPRLLWRPLNLYSNIGRAIVGVFFGLLDQVASVRGYIKVEPLASLVPQAALRAVAIALRFRLQIRLIGKRFLLATLNDRRALVITDCHTVCHESNAARLEPQRPDCRFQETIAIPGVIAIRLAAAVPLAHLLALVRRNVALLVIIPSFHIAPSVKGE